MESKKEAIVEQGSATDDEPLNKEVLDIRVKQMSSFLSMQTPRYDPQKSILSQSVDTTTFREYLGSQKNRFQDLLTFGDKSKPSKVPLSRVRDNELLDEIHQKLMDPSLKTEMLQKSLIVRDPEAPMKEKKK